MIGVVVLLSVAGGVGSVARFMLDGFSRSRIRTVVPAGTFLINVSGSLLLGFLSGLVLAQLAPTDLRLILGTGFLGGYTTFSTASFETVRLLQERRIGAAMINGLGMLVITVAVALAGLVLGTLV